MKITTTIIFSFSLAEDKEDYKNSKDVET